MACQLPPPPPAAAAAAESIPPAPSTIFSIGDDLLLEIFIRLPSLPSLVRAAFACRTFLHAVGSFPTFRPRFRALHPPPLIGLFLRNRDGDIPSFAPLRGRADDPDHAAVLRGSDFFLTRIPDDEGFWHINHCHDGYLLLHNWEPRVFAAYNPLAGLLHLIPRPPEAVREHHIMSSPEERHRHGSFRIVSIHEDGLQVRPVVYSSDTATLQFSSMDLPPVMYGQKPFVVGDTKDEKLCVVCAIDDENLIAVWVWRADDDDARVEKWMLDYEIESEDIPEMKLVAVNRGFLHLHLMSVQQPGIVPLAWFFSLCVETEELKKIFSLYEDEIQRSYPYTMPWPSSLLCNKVNPAIGSAS